MRSDRWARALHDLYLVTLVIAFVATAVSFPAGTDRLVAGAAVAVLGGVDLVARPRQGIGYFLAAGLAVGLLTTLFPTFAAVAFGLLPLAFVRLPRWAAIVTGVVATGTPYLARPVVQAILAGVGWQPGATIRFGPAYFAVVGIALPVPGGSGDLAIALVLVLVLILRPDGITGGRELPWPGGLRRRAPRPSSRKQSS